MTGAGAIGWPASERIGLVLLGLTVAGAGQYLLWRRESPHLAVLLFVVAGACLSGVVPVGERWAAPAQAAKARFQRWRLAVLLSLAVAAIGCVDVWLRHPIFAWGYLGALVALAVGAWLADPPEGARAVLARWRPGWGTLLVGALLAVSFFVRVWQWDSVPPGAPPDEPWHVINARILLEDHPNTTPFDVPQWRHPNVHHFLAALLLLPRTDPQLALVLLGAIPGTIAIGLLYLVVREANGPAVALVAAALLSLDRWYVLFTRKGDDVGLPLSLTLAALWFALQGLRSGRLVWFVLAGIACGVNLIYLYLGSLAVLWVFLAWLILRRMGGLSTRDGLLGLAVSGVAALCVFLPRLFTIYLRPDILRYSSQHLAPWAGQGDALDLFWRQLTQAVIAFGFQSGGHPWLVFDDRGPAMFDALSAALAMMGVGYFLWRIREPWARFWLITGILGLVAGAASAGAGGYNWRLLMTLPTLMVGAGLVLVGVARALTSPVPRAPGLAWAPIVLALVFVGLSTYRDYFVAFRERESVWLEGSAHSLRATRWLRERSDLLPSTLVVTSRDIGRSAPFLLLRPEGLGKVGPHVMLDDLSQMPLVVDLPPGIERAWIMTAADPWEGSALGVATRGIGDMARRYYPDGEEQLVRDPGDGRPLFYVRELSREQIEDRQGLARAPNAQCIGSSTVGGWRGMIYVPAPGRYRLDSTVSNLCANVDLLETNLFAREAYLSRGWHQIVLTGGAGDPPPLRLVTAARAVPLPPWQMYSGPPRPIGFEATFADAPGAPPIARRYLTAFDRAWEPYPPTGGSTFYLELRGRLELAQSGLYAFRWFVAGPTQVLLDGEVVASTDSEAPGVLQGTRELTAGAHAIEISYHARSLATTWARITPPGGPERFLDLRFVSPP